MTLTRLIYASRSKVPFTLESIAELVQRSAVRNAESRISGSLIYCDGFFLQWLEGGQATVRATFERIAKDPRHFDVHELSHLPLSQRMFPGWGMSFLHEQTVSDSERRRIQSMSLRLQSLAVWDDLGEPARQLMEDLRSTIDRQMAKLAPPRAA